MRDTPKIPKVIRTAEINIGGFIMRVHNLDNGQRVIDAEDIERLFNTPAHQLTEEQAMILAKALKEQ